MADISDLGLCDKVYHRTWGEGIVIRCTEKPTVTVQFAVGVKTFSQKTQDQLEVRT